jgi:hypothetical protein
LIGLLIAIAFAAPVDATAVAHDTVALQTKLFDEIEQHCFTMRIFQEEPGDDPRRKKETRLEHVCFRDGVPVYNRLEINGKPTGIKMSDPFPPPNDEWRKRAEKIREARKTQIDIAQQCLQAFTFSFVTEAVMEGRPALVIDFKPNPVYHAQSRTTELLRVVSGRAWIDRESHYLMKIEAKTFKDFALWGGIIARVKEGAWLEMRQNKFGDAWLPYFLEERWEGKIAMMHRVGDHFRLERFDFQRGTADKR